MIIVCSRYKLPIIPVAADLKSGVLGKTRLPPTVQAGG